MPGINGNSQEDRCNSDLLHEHLEKEGKAIEDHEHKVSMSMLKGGEYYPFSPDNLAEAMSNLSDSHCRVLAAFMDTADHLQTDVSRVYAHQTFAQFVTQYWTDVAHKNID